MRCSVGFTFQGDCGHVNYRGLGESPFQIVISRLAFGQSEAPAIIMDHDAHMIRVVEGRCTAICEAEITRMWSRNCVRFADQDSLTFVFGGTREKNELDSTSRPSRDVMIFRSLDAVGELGSTFLRISSSIDEAKASLAFGVVIL